MRAVLLFFAGLLGLSSANYDKFKGDVVASNQCVQFSVSAGTGCAWMCNYCASQLGTNNYYFTDGVCTYQQGVGCMGNPLAGKTYTCCAV